MDMMSEKSLNKIKCFEKLSFASILPHITSQNCSTFDSFDDFWPFSAKNFLISIFLLQHGKLRTLLNPEFLSH